MTKVKLQIFRSPNEVREAIFQARREGKTVGVVPTMGALHQGHLSLALRSQKDCDMTIATIFVNPTQFGPDEDFNQYPRTFDEDVRQLEELGVAAVFAPPADVIYRPDHSTYVEPPDVSLPLEGAHRPGHFRGVATIVLKLFNIIPADIAYFGQKDYQQTLVISRMVDDLDLPIRIEVCPIVREADGLAMSSRNVYLDTKQRQTALAVNRSLKLAEQQICSGETDAHAIEASMHKELQAAGIHQIDYATLADPQTLTPLEQVKTPVVALVAAYVGKTRLIDNQIIE